MAKKSTMMMPLAIIVLGGGIGFWWWNSRDKTPVGLVVTNVLQGDSPLGVNEDGDSIKIGAVEGTWREDENSVSVASDGEEKPLLVIYQEGIPIDAKVITMSEWDRDKFEDLPEECDDDHRSSECEEAVVKRQNAIIQKFRDVAEEHNVTEESINNHFPLMEESNESTQSQAAESIYGPMLSLQSHFVW